MVNSVSQFANDAVHYNILAKCVVSEKSTYHSTVRNCYLFDVPISVNKLQIRSIIEKNWSVRVLRVRTMINKASFSKGSRRTGYTKFSKVALVTLHRDDRLSFF